MNVQPGIAGIALGKLDAAGNLTGPSTVASVKLLGIPAAVIGTSADIDVASPADESLEFSGPFPAAAQTVGTPLGSALAGALADLAADLSLQVTVVGLPLGALLSPVLTAISTTLGPSPRSVMHSSRRCCQPSGSPWEVPTSRCSRSTGSNRALGSNSHDMK